VTGSHDFAISHGKIIGMEDLDVKYPGESASSAAGSVVTPDLA
jgi:hypothetical protein